MSYCVECGNELQPGSGFCNKCGKQISNSKPYEAPAQNANAFYGTPTQGRDVRCVRCGAVISGGMPFCGLCRQPALGKQGFEHITSEGRPAKNIKKKHSFAAFAVIAVCTLVVLLLLFVLIAALANTTGSEEFEAFANDHMSVIFIVTMISTPFIIFLFWGIARSRAFKKAGMTFERYKYLLKKYKNLPKEFFDPLPSAQIREVKGLQTNYAPNKSGAKSIAYIALSLVILCAAGFAVYFGLFDTGSVASGGSGGTLSGRWEGQVIGYSTNNNGVNLVQGDSIAIVFRGSKAYFGSSLNSTEGIIEECEGWNQGIATYKIGSGTITFTSNGTSKTYDFDGTTIYMDGYKVKKVS